MLPNCGNKAFHKLYSWRSWKLCSIWRGNKQTWECFYLFKWSKKVLFYSCALYTDISTILHNIIGRLPAILLKKKKYFSFYQHQAISMLWIKWYEKGDWCNFLLCHHLIKHSHLLFFLVDLACAAHQGQKFDRIYFFAISFWRKLFSYTQLKLHGCHISLLPPRDNRISSATLAFYQILVLFLLYFDQAI